MNHKKASQTSPVQTETVLILEIIDKEILSVIPSTKQDKEEEGDIVAKQAGLVLRNLSFRDIFSVNLALFLCAMFILMLRDYFSTFVNSLNYDKLISTNT